MIYCKHDELKKFKNYSQNMACAIDYILSSDLSVLPFGKTQIDGDNVYIVKSEVETKNDVDMPYEAHKRYIDIHVDVSGSEEIQVLHGRAKIVKPYDEADDYTLYESTKSDVCMELCEKRYAVIFPKELHKSGIGKNGERIVKCVVKIQC